MKKTHLNEKIIFRRSAAPPTLFVLMAMESPYVLEIQALPTCLTSAISEARGDHGKPRSEFVMESEWNRKLIVAGLNMKMNVYVRLAMHAVIMGEW